MTEFKDFIPVGKDNDSNSGDSWFVLSSASEEEENDNEPNMELEKSPQKEIAAQKENDCEVEKPNVDQSEPFQKEITEQKENDFGDTKSEKKENEKNFQKEADEKKLNEEEMKPVQIETIKTEIVEETKVIEKKVMPMETDPLQTNADGKPAINDEEEKKLTEAEALQTQAPEKLKINDEVQNKSIEIETSPEKLKIPGKAEINNLEHKDQADPQKETPKEETSKKIMVNRRHKLKGLLAEGESHSEIALEVHALRETLIQLSLNLSNTEEEKYAAISSEVQALRETLSQLGNDLSYRVGQIETRTEQVHTLLCRFIMTKCGNYTEPETNVKHHCPNTSHVAVQTETLDAKQTASPVLPKSSTVASNQTKTPPTNENKEDTLTHTVENNRAPNESKDVPSSSVSSKDPNESKDVSHSSAASKDLQSSSHGLKRPRSDDNPSQTSKESYNSEICGESTSCSSPASLKQGNEFSKFSKGKVRNPYRSRHHWKSQISKTSRGRGAHFKAPKESFHRYPSASYVNQELAKLAYRYSSESARHRQKNRSNQSWQPSNRPWQPGANRKYPYSTQAHKGQNLHPSDTKMDKPLDELGDYMDKVIDEWAQEDDY